MTEMNQMTSMTWMTRMTVMNWMTRMTGTIVMTGMTRITKMYYMKQGIIMEMQGAFCQCKTIC